MSDLIPPGVLSDRDVRAAQAVLDAWLEGLPPVEPGPAQLRIPRPFLLELRGLLAQQYADVRAAGVLEGHQVGLAQGRREHAEELLDVLMDRGLLP